MTERSYQGIDWERQYGAKEKPNELLFTALGYVIFKDRALDFGAGSLVDTHVLLDEGFYVDAIDGSEAFAHRAAEIDSENFSFTQSDFEDARLPASTYDLINVQNSSAFVKQSEFTRVVTMLLESLKPGGVIAINFFGERDGRQAVDQPLVFISKDEVTKIFEGLEIILFNEKEEGTKDLLNRPLHNHTFEVIARKPAT